MNPTFQIDCTHCFGLYCTVLTFSKSSDNGHDKAEATPCHELVADYSCRIHAQYSGRRDQTPRDWGEKQLQGRIFSGASVQNQWLLATNLSRSNLRGVNFLGAD